MNKFKMGSMKRGAALMLLGLLMPYSSHALTASGNLSATATVQEKTLNVVSAGDIAFEDIEYGDQTVHSKDAVFNISGTKNLPITGKSVLISNASPTEWLTDNSMTKPAIGSTDGNGDAQYTFQLTTVPGEMGNAGDYTATVALTVTF